MKQKTDDFISESLSTNYSKYYRLAYGYVHNESDAMDIVQEAAAKAVHYFAAASLRT